MLRAEDDIYPNQRSSGSFSFKPEETSCCVVFVHVQVCTHINSNCLQLKENSGLLVISLINLFFDLKDLKLKYEFIK